MVSPATDLNNNHVYVIEECDDPEMPAQMFYRKIGVLAESTCDKGIYHLRERALNQGNPRGVKVVFSINLGDRSTAEDFEQKIHQILHYRGIPSRVLFTGMTGHSEWFKISRELAIEIIQEEYSKLPKSVIFSDLFNF